MGEGPAPAHSPFSGPTSARRACESSCKVLSVFRAQLVLALSPHRSHVRVPRASTASVPLSWLSHLASISVSPTEQGAKKVLEKPRWGSGGLGRDKKGPVTCWWSQGPGGHIHLPRQQVRDAASPQKAGRVRAPCLEPWWAWGCFDRQNRAEAMSFQVPAQARRDGSAYSWACSSLSCVWTDLTAVAVTAQVEAPRPHGEGERPSCAGLTGTPTEMPGLGCS